MVGCQNQPRNSKALLLVKNITCKAQFQNEKEVFSSLNFTKTPEGNQIHLEFAVILSSQIERFID